MPACDAGGAVLEVDVQHPVHLGDADHDGVRLRIAPPESEVPAPRGDHRHALCVEEAQDRRDLLGGATAAPPPAAFADRR